MGDGNGEQHNVFYRCPVYLSVCPEEETLHVALGVHN